MNPLDKILIAIGVVIVAFVVGLGVMHAHDAGNIARIKLEYNAQVNAAQNAKAAAEQRATNTERGQKAAIADALATYEKDRQDEKAHDTAVISDLRNDVVRLRVSTHHGPAPSCALPGAPAGAEGAADPGSETLAGPVAARLAGRYADYNRIVGKLSACQAVIQADRLNAPN